MGGGATHDWVGCMGEMFTVKGGRQADGGGGAFGRRMGGGDIR